MSFESRNESVFTNPVDFKPWHTVNSPFVFVLQKQTGFSPRNTHTHISYESQGHCAVAFYEVIFLFNTRVLQDESVCRNQFNPRRLLRETHI